MNVSNSFNMLLNPPQFDPRASALLGSPRAFLLDNNIMPLYTTNVGYIGVELFGDTFGASNDAIFGST